LIYKVNSAIFCWRLLRKCLVWPTICVLRDEMKAFSSGFDISALRRTSADGNNSDQVRFYAELFDAYDRT
jgi:hypothetical protein